MLKSLCLENFEETGLRQSCKLFDDVTMLQGSSGMFLVSIKSFLTLFIILLLNDLWFESFDMCRLLRFRFVSRLRIWYNRVDMTLSQVQGFERFDQEIKKTLILVKKI